MTLVKSLQHVTIFFENVWWNTPRHSGSKVLKFLVLVNLGEGGGGCTFDFCLHNHDLTRLDTSIFILVKFNVTYVCELSGMCQLIINAV